MAAGVSSRFAGIKDSTSVDLYLHVDKAAPSITVDTSLNDASITVDSITDIAAGDVIDILEGIRFYQSIVTSAAGNTVGLGSPLDFAFTTAAIISTGHWNLARDGSGSTVTAYTLAPPNAGFQIHQISVSMTDGTEMDSAKFGGITALTNGILFRVINGITKNLPLVVNNMGFMEQGFDIQYDPKAAAGVFGFHAVKNYSETNGVVIQLDGTNNDELQCLIRDDLTALTLMAITINGHVI